MAKLTKSARVRRLAAKGLDEAAIRQRIPDATPSEIRAARARGDRPGRPPGDNDAQVTVRLPAELLARVDAMIAGTDRCAVVGCSRNDLLVAALQLGVEKLAG